MNKREKKTTGIKTNTRKERKHYERAKNNRKRTKPKPENKKTGKNQK